MVEKRASRFKTDIRIKPEKAKVRVSPCLFRVGGKLESFETPFYRRSELPVEETFPGPAVILQPDSTTLVPPGATYENTVDNRAWQ